MFTPHFTCGAPFSLPPSLSLSLSLARAPATVPNYHWRLTAGRFATADHGYRYVQVEGLPTEPDSAVLTGHFVHTNVHTPYSVYASLHIDIYMHIQQANVTYA